MVLRTRQADDKLVVYLEGRMDVAVAQEVEEELARMIDYQGVRHMILNLEDLEHMSSSGFRACIGTLRKLDAVQGTLKLCNIRPEIYEVFAITRLNRLFDIKDDEADALAAF